MTRPRLPRPALRGSPRPLPRAALFAAALALALGACDNVRPRGDAPREVETTEQADTPKAAASASRPAPRRAPEQTPADTCRLEREFAAWSDSSLAQKRYGVYVAVRLAMMETESLPSATAADSAAAARVCQAARAQELSPFLAVYRPVRPTTVLTQDVVRTLGDVAAPIAASVSDTATRVASATRDSANPADSVDAETPLAEVPTVHRVEVPQMWLAALIGLIAIAGAALGYALWRLGWMIRDSEHQVRESHHRHLENSTRSLKDEFGKAQQTTLAETKNYFGRVGSEVAMLRDQVVESLRKKGGTGALPGADAGTGLHARGGKNALVLEPDPYARWEKTAVDVRPADGGSATIHADVAYGVFTVRWVPDSGAEAWLSVNPSRLLGAVYRDKLDAAFQCQGVSRRTGRYHTVEEALCTWDPLTGQGRIEKPGLVEEIE